MLATGKFSFEFSISLIIGTDRTRDLSSESKLHAENKGISKQW